MRRARALALLSKPQEAAFACTDALIGDGSVHDLRPNPDYFNALLFKRLVGTGVLDVQGAAEPGRQVRTYAFCANAASYTKGAVTVLALNTGDEPARVEVRLDRGGGVGNITTWVLTGCRGLAEATTCLDGKPLEVGQKRGFLPPLDGRRLAAGTPWALPPRSYSFAVVDAAAPACLDSEPRRAPAKHDDAAPSAPQLATFHPLDLTKYPNARCLDGSPGGFYLYRPKIASSRWLLYFEGGGWCAMDVPTGQKGDDGQQVDSCWHRSFGWLGSTTTRPSTSDLNGGY
eukprot:COSAG04_NODE_9398_length_867_cov_1.595052_1_plen_286_part_10